MQREISIQVLPAEATNATAINEAIAVEMGVHPQRISGYSIKKKSIDARQKNICIVLQMVVFVDEPFVNDERKSFRKREVSKARQSAIIVGAGPAGLFAAMQLIEDGIQPIIIERGKNVRDRRRDLAMLNKEGTLNPESNYCFGEGGAGTYSDGKLYTRSNKRGDIPKILQTFIEHGADERIFFEAHPHIGTNKLPHIITAMRLWIEDCGGKVLFNKKLVDIELDKGKILSIKTSDGDKLKADAYILATGHSARDIYTLLHQKQIAIEAKPFALGVRIEHPQSIIDSIQYHCTTRSEHLPPASYALVSQENDRGVFSFCMCPGGIIAPASTDAGELVVNGWSPSKRNNPFANSGMVVQVEMLDAANFLNEKQHLEDPMLLLRFQKAVEQKSFIAGGGKFVAPAQRVADFVDKKASTTLPDCSYLPGIASNNLNDVLPPFIHNCLRKGLQTFGKKMKGYVTNEAILVATESRTSSPIRILRDREKLCSPSAANLFPCAEGAGYAGGIVSAAMDGVRVAAKIAEQITLL